MKRKLHVGKCGRARYVVVALFCSGAFSCKETASEDAACGLEVVAPEQTAAEILGSDYTSDPPRGPELSWFVPHTPAALQSFSYAKLVYGALGAGDIDGDGKVDLLAVGRGTTFGVFLGRDGFEFKDATTAAGLAEQRGSTLALGDLDNDGDLDLATSERLTLTIFANDGHGVFTQTSRLTSAPEVPANQLLLVDIDNDGLLDIFGSYPPGLSAYDRSGPNRLFRNRGQLAFVDASEDVSLPNDGNSWTSGAADLDGDDDQDIVVANDGNVIDFGDRSEATNEVELPDNGALINQSGPPQKLEDQATELGLQGPYSSMGVVFEDLDRDGDFEIFITDFGANKLLERGENGVYAEVASEMGLDPAQRINDFCDADTERADCLLVSWGAAFRDFDLDGEDEVLIANHEADTGIAQPLQLFKKTAGRYQEYSLSIPNLTAHALITADFDGDGDLDFATSTVGGKILVFENTVGNRCTGNWLGLSLEGSTSNRQGLGATVTVEQEDGQKQTRLVTSGGVAHGSLLSQAHFGLGKHEAKRITVRWPSGKSSTLDDVPERTRVSISEPQ